jgi:hypothetical protein
MAKNTRKATRKVASRKNQAGGKKSRKMSEWNKKVMGVYREMKRKNPATRLGDAMKEASRRFK